MSRALGLIGFPMNPFRVVVEDAEFKCNPLIGVVGISYLKENVSALIRDMVYFAHIIDADLVYKHLCRAGYGNVAIKDFFSGCRDCGLLRPVSSSAIIDSDPVEHRDIHESYVVDVRALGSYYDLIYCRHPKLSMVFHNSALRAHYDIVIGQHLDNILYEALTGLVFLSDLMRREEHLESMMSGTGVLFQPLTSRIRSAFISYLGGIICSSREKGGGGKAGEELLGAVNNLFEQVKRRIARSPGII